MPSIGPLELGIILVIVLLIFGPKRLPGLGKQLGTGMREFKDSITGESDHEDRALEPAPEDRDASKPEPAQEPVAAETAAPETTAADAETRR